MIHYKDMTFCQFYDGCENGHDCFRALTPETVKAATQWWGEENPPICQYVEEPECFKKKFEQWDFYS